MAADCPIRAERALGSGAYGEVLLVQTPLGPRALKVQSFSDSRPSFQELDILTRFRHPNLISAEALILPQQCQGLIPNPGIGILMPLAKRTLNALGPASAVNIRHIMFQLLSGLAFLHENNYVHLDIKPQNILCYEDYGETPHVAISDFGLARYLDNPRLGLERPSDSYVTMPYRPPENLRGSTRWSSATDIWSLGIVFLELLTGFFGLTYPPENSWTPEATLERIESRLVKDWDHFIEVYLSPRHQPRAELIELLKGMLDLDPERRWTVQQALYSPFFKGLTPVPGRLRSPVRPSQEPNQAQRAVVRRLLSTVPRRVMLGCYFLALDLMFRAVGIAPNEEDYENYAYVALSLAYSIYDYQSLLPSEAFIPAQLKLAVDLEGMLAPPYLFRAARSKAQLEALHPRFHEVVGVYHSLDIATLFSQVIEPLGFNLITKVTRVENTAYSRDPEF